jgi:predicted nucleic acid-binding protein
VLNHSILPIEHYKAAIELCKSIDIDDTVFVAFTLFMNGKLWTGDKRLLKGLSDKNFEQFVTTDELYTDFIRKDRSKK